MTLDLDKMTQAEFDELMVDLKENEPNLFQFIVDVINKKSIYPGSRSFSKDGT